MSNFSPSEEPAFGAGSPSIKELMEAFDIISKLGMSTAGKPCLVDTLWDTELSNKQKEKIEKTLEQEFKKAVTLSLRKKGATKEEAQKVLKTVWNMKMTKPEIVVDYKQGVSSVSQKIKFKNG